VYCWSLDDPLPTVPVPLAKGDPEAMLDLQAAFLAAYEDGGFDYSLDRSRDSSPVSGA
jgi:hypothetical protein